MQAVSESGRIRVKNNRLFKTNAVISLILLIGFALTAALSYHANYRTSLDSMEQIYALLFLADPAAATVIYRQLLI